MKNAVLRRNCIFAAIAVAAVTATGWRMMPEPTDHQRALLWAELWMQTSAEYVACCLQTYRTAGDRVAIESQRLRAECDQLAPSFQPKPPCVVMDLDETVLDNGVYQSYLYLSGERHSTELFSEFVTKHRTSIRLVPGAGKFIRRVESQGVEVVYITNRPESLRGATIETLAQWGVNTRGLEAAGSDRLLMKRNDSNKTPRRNLVREKYEIIALVGDQLTDFAEEFAYERDATDASLRAAVQEYDDQWGSKWFILPNPVYGDWQMLLKGEPANHLRRAVSP